MIIPKESIRFDLCYALSLIVTGCFFLISILTDRIESEWTSYAFMSIFFVIGIWGLASVIESNKYYKEKEINDY